jgi:hypothetical protein
VTRSVSALYGAVLAAVSSLLLVVQGVETLSDVTVAEWLTVLAAVLSSSALAQWLGAQQPTAPPAVEPDGRPGE